MSLDEGKTHYVGDGCQPAHDPRIDQAPDDDVSEHYDARGAAEAYRRASTGTGPVSFEELHAEYLVEIDAKVRAEQEVERLRAVAHAANGAFLAFAKAPPELADDHELTRAMSTLGAALDSYDTLRESS
jgi:hypothetical protein